MAVQRVVRNTGIIVLIGISIIAVSVYVLFKSYSQRMQVRVNLAEAEAEISSIEVALVTIQADAGVKTHRELFDHDAFNHALDVEMQRSNSDAVAATIEIHSTIAQTLMQYGNKTAKILAASDDTNHLTHLVPEEILKRLGNSYMDDAP